MLNTLLLLASGLALTVTHLSLVEQDKLFRAQLWVRSIGVFLSNSTPYERSVIGTGRWVQEIKHTLNQAMNAERLVMAGTTGLLSGCRFAYDNLAVTVGAFVYEFKEIESENLNYASI